MIQNSKSTLSQILPIWLLGCLLLIAISWNQITGLAGWDPDDQLRLVQLRDLLGGQSWFESNQYRLNAPFGTTMHWSRITELPLALIVLLLSPIFGPAIAEMIAGTVIPLLLLGTTGWLLADIARRIGNGNAAPVAMILCLLTATTLAQMMPMRIDHHGWQIMLASLSLWTIFRPNKRNNGIWLGSAMALWLHISLEGAPLAAAFFAYLGWRWIFHKAHGERLLWTILSFLTASLLLFFATAPNGFSAPIWCDAISASHLAAIGAASAIMLPAIILRPKSQSARFVAAVAAGAAAFGCLLCFAPTCASGAFAEMHPLVRDYWYVNVTEGLPIWQQGSISKISWLMPAIMGLVAIFVMRIKQPSAQREPTVVLAFFQIFSLLVALLVFRAAAVACAFAIPLLANWLTGMIEKYRSTRLPIAKVKLAFSMLAIAMAGPILANVGNVVFRIASSPIEQASAQGEVINKLCQSPASAASLSALPKSNIVATFDMGPAILLTTQHSILASSHHRNVDGMRDQIMLFRSSPEVAEKIIRKRGIGYLAICPDEAEMRQYVLRDPRGLWAQMANGKVPAWLQPMDDIGNEIKLWKVVS
jgi:hypothetical protein